MSESEIRQSTILTTRAKNALHYRLRISSFEELSQYSLGYLSKLKQVGPQALDSIKKETDARGIRLKANEEFYKERLAERRAREAAIAPYQKKIQKLTRQWEILIDQRLALKKKLETNEVSVRQWNKVYKANYEMMGRQKEELKIQIHELYKQKDAAEKQYV